MDPKNIIRCESNFGLSNIIFIVKTKAKTQGFNLMEIVTEGIKQEKRIKMSI